ncbi:substrate-binding domain-containing protein [Halarchaeum nitratireducens]|uniref:Uncharacterized protein n=1 Tax=Halarchaeum nitratireducens TaxID=489913 RepID=A0A830GDG6_9EURY|nr:hypothetical protein [Halarchaeum nitratireducens]GGN22824.1 hypothetical protein GCM10009021_25570 [Halarchaeum nitratireducens]
MGCGSDTNHAPTRRDAIKGGSAVLGGGLLAGCSSSRREPDATATAEATSDGATTEDVDPYEVTVRPGGTGTFDDPPETYATIPGVWMDLAMGFGIPPKAVASFNRISLDYYDALPGVEFDADDVLTFGTEGESGSYDKEVLYEIDADVHLMDPRLLKRYSGWDEGDLDEIEANVGPILGSFIRFPYGGRDPYYSLYEAFEKAAEVFQRRQQYERGSTSRRRCTRRSGRASPMRRRPSRRSTSSSPPTTGSSMRRTSTRRVTIRGASVCSASKTRSRRASTFRTPQSATKSFSNSTPTTSAVSVTSLTGARRSSSR